jgi:GNAT superfamily N-acetyltransferase
MFQNGSSRYRSLEDVPASKPDARASEGPRDRPPAADHRGESYREHLLRLDPESRRSRFGGGVSDRFILEYSEPSALRNAILHGFFADGVLRGVSELRALAAAGEAEAALSIERDWQSRGVGTALLARTLLAARNSSIERLRMICLAENRRMQRLARKFAAHLHFESGSMIAELEAPRAPLTPMLRELGASGTGFPRSMLDGQSRFHKAA